MEVLAVQISVSFAVAEWPLKGRCAKAAAASAPGARRNQNAATPQSGPKQNKRCLIFTYELMMLLWLTVQQAGASLKGPLFCEETKRTCSNNLQFEPFCFTLMTIHFLQTCL